MNQKHRKIKSKKDKLGLPNFNSVVHFLLVDFGWWRTILGLVGDHYGDGG